MMNNNADCNDDSCDVLANLLLQLESHCEFKAQGCVR